jgi:acyl-CoA reductase-like NAD-dependent aldehyde dehydrogenase
MSTDREHDVSILGRKQLLIGGEWRDASDGRTMPVINPATEEVIAEVAAATRDDVDAAVQAARAALAGPWGQMSARERGRLLWTLGERLTVRIDEIARLETLHNGKPITESRHIEVPMAIECLQYFAGWADKIQGETVPVKANAHVYTRREPLGVVAAIVPWNFPLLLAMWKVAPALAAGNTVILKPASQTPLTAIALGDAANEVGLPPGVLNIITGGGSTAGQALVEHPGVAKIAFTGDTSTGKGIMRTAAETLKHITLELGGKSPNIVFPDADLDAAIRGATVGIFYGKGEVCAAGSRLLVDRSIKAEFLDKVAARTKKMVAGDPMDPKTRFGSLSSKAHLERVLNYVEIAKSEGATLIAGGARADIGTGKGYFMQPTVFADVTPSMTIAREEIFGPVLAAIEFADVDEAIAIANDSMYGLAAGVWTRDVKKAHHVASRLQAGTVWVNTYNVYDTAAPFGGYKQSGFGREMSQHALDSYTQIKTVWVDLS